MVRIVLALQPAQKNNGASTVPNPLFFNNVPKGNYDGYNNPLITRAGPPLHNLRGHIFPQPTFFCKGLL